jgi:hypothetical protein
LQPVSRSGTLKRVDEEQGIYRGEVMAIMIALADLQTDTREILDLLGYHGDDDEAEEDT